MAAARHVEPRPRAAGGAGVGVVRVEPLLERAQDWSSFLDAGLGTEAHAAIASYDALKADPSRGSSLEDARAARQAV